MNDRTTQTNNTVEGDQAAHDVIKTIHNYGDSQGPVLYMRRLLQDFERERNSDQRLNEYIEELNHFYAPLEGDVAGLEQKLKDGSCEGYLQWALMTKERFRKMLEKYRFSEAAQRISVELLGRVLSNFEHQVAPRLKAGLAPEEIGELIKSKIVDPISSALLENSLNFTDLEINGMLFFLTGNCHIKLKK